MKDKILRFIRANFIIWSFWAVMLIVELTGVCVTSGKFYIRNPFMFFSLLGIFTAVLFTIKNQKGRYWCAFVLMAALFVVDLIFIVIFEMTGGSMFSFYMFSLRGDAMTIIEKLQVNFVYVLVSGVAISIYAVLAYYYKERAPKPERILPKPVVAVIMALVLVFHGGMAYLGNYDYNPADLTYLLYSNNDGTYSDRGIFGNFVTELYKGAFFNKVPLGDVNELEDFIYESNTDEYEKELVFNPDIGAKQVFGAATGYNVVTILAESLEWFAFMSNLADAGFDENNPAFPNGFDYSFKNDDTKSAADVDGILRNLYPNLYKLYETSVVALNHHSREKTDVSENQSIIGNYPTGDLINYSFTDNTVPYSLPRVLGKLDGNIRSRSYHNGNYEFYNRGNHHTKVLGFEQFTAIEQMIAADVDHKIFDSAAASAWSKNEHNLDTHMIEACKQEMFPADRRFNTYITTIAMHGQYDFRKNLAPYYRMLIESGIADPYIKDSYTEPDIPDDKTQAERDEIIMKAKIAALDVDNPDPFIHYAAAAIDFDRALGMMMDYLSTTESKLTGRPLINDTLIVIFGDHNAYYQGIGDIVKDLSISNPDRNYTDLYRVPLFVHVGNQTEQIKIEKFTCTVDIVPTIFDLLGIKIFDNLNYGSTIFGDKESIIYSCSYDAFITDKLFFTSINNIRYRTKDATQADVKDAEKRALELLNKTSHVNRIFYHDFLSGDRADTYYKKLIELNTVQPEQTEE